MFKLSTSTKIYLACPANVATGGPELLHQLGAQLHKQGLQSFMYYLGYKSDKHTSPVHSEYLQYEVPHCFEFEDLENNLLIVPEIGTKMFTGVKNAQKCIWWLSVDNYFKTFRGKSAIRIWFKSFMGSLGLRRAPYIISKDYDKPITHLAQSHYAIDFLEKNGVSDKKVRFLSDYLNEHFLNKNQLDYSHKKNQVAYNPKKGQEYTQQLIAAAPEIEFIPIQNMTRDEVSTLLSESKIYIDFGEHPGKDRIPREACMSGACVITGTKGSARFSEDVPIPKKFKFDESVVDIRDIVKTIKDVFQDFPSASNEFSAYRQFILAEPEKFIQDAESAFAL